MVGYSADGVGEVRSGRVEVVGGGGGVVVVVVVDFGGWFRRSFMWSISISGWRTIVGTLLWTAGRGCRHDDGVAR